MKAINGKQLCHALESKGWVLARITGSHHIYIKAGLNHRLAVPVHGKKDLKIGLLRAIMRIADIKDDEL
jgi:predicted RNA binding protein YcfA (HicA-like mRNA interferase family)